MIKESKVVAGPFTLSARIAAIIDQAPNKSALVEQILGMFWSDDDSAVQVVIQTPTGEFTMGLSVANAHSAAEQIIAQLQRLEGVI